MIGLPLIRPWSLPEAISDPVNVTDPITTSSTVKIVVETLAVWPAGRDPHEVVDRDERGRAAAHRVEERHQLRHRGHLHGPRGVEAEAAADGEADHDHDPADDAHAAGAGDQVEERGADRHDHAAGRQQVAVAGGRRRVHQVEPEHEAGGAGELGESDEGVDVHRGPRQACAAGFGAAGFFLNIWSIRSVTT